MWVATFRMWHRSHMLELTLKYRCRAHVYYLNEFTERGKKYVAKASLVDGPQAEQVVREIARDPRIRTRFMKGNQIFYDIPAVESFHTSVLSKTVFPLKPQLAENGFEWWTLASTSKKALQDIVKKVRAGGATIELLSLRKENPNFFAAGALADMTRLQREALLTAFRHGYYEYPRKTNLKKLSAQLKIPRTTLTEHLRKAEGKLMPVVLEAEEP